MLTKKKPNHEHKLIQNNHKDCLFQESSRIFTLTSIKVFKEFQSMPSLLKCFLKILVTVEIVLQKKKQKVAQLFNNFCDLSYRFSKFDIFLCAETWSAKFREILFSIELLIYRNILLPCYLRYKLHRL